MAPIGERRGVGEIDLATRSGVTERIICETGKNNERLMG